MSSLLDIPPTSSLLDIQVMSGLLDIQAMPSFLDTETMSKLLGGHSRAVKFTRYSNYLGIQVTSNLLLLNTQVMSSLLDYVKFPGYSSYVRFTRYSSFLGIQVTQVFRTLKLRRFMDIQVTKVYWIFKLRKVSWILKLTARWPQILTGYQCWAPISITSQTDGILKSPYTQ